MSRHAAEAEKWVSRERADVSSVSSGSCCFGCIVPLFRFVKVCHMQHALASAKAMKQQKVRTGLSSSSYHASVHMVRKARVEVRSNSELPEATIGECNIHPKFLVGTCITSMD